MQFSPKDCPSAHYHGNPFHYCDTCTWSTSDDDTPTARQWRDAALVLRHHADIFDSLAEEANDTICGVILANAGLRGEPVACAFRPGHLPSPHSWAFIPTVER